MLQEHPYTKETQKEKEKGNYGLISKPAKFYGQDSVGNIAS